MYNQKPVIVAVILFVICAITIGMATVMSYRHRPKLTLSDNSVVVGKSVSDIGRYGEPGYEYLQVRDLEAKRVYKTLTMSPVSADPAKLAPLFEDLIRSELKKRPAVAHYVTVKMFQELRSKVALVIASDSGMTRENYVSHFPGARPLPPESVVMPEGKTPEMLFNEFYDEKLSSGVQLRSICLDPKSVALSFNWYRLPDDVRQGLLDKSDQYPASFLGMNVASARGFVFYRNPNYEALMKKQAEVLCFSGSFIVESNALVTGPDGKENYDRYPLNMTFVFDPETKEWWLEHVERTVSVVASNQKIMVN
ncbi:MAG TPA: hypothetical protein PLF31_00405 [Candidatus Paceibacterota bacterium]|nr:hypothetical protein [Candidatus Paceibacterota bacterium]